MLSTWTFITFIYCYKWMDQLLLEARNPVPQQLDFSLYYLKFIKVALKAVFPVNISGQREMSVLNVYSSACLQNMLTSLHEGHAPVLNILTPQFPFRGCINIFLLLLSGWPIHTVMKIVAAEKNRQRLPNSEDKAFYMCIWVKWWNLTWADLLMSIEPG